ncbi:MAG: response regulator [Nitrospirota bacterium]|nr:response regulator [Nitrospirota bacterium]
MEKTLLIVEDDENISKALEVRLSARGFNVVTAFDAIIGMQKAVQMIPDAIVLDITLPGGNGLALAQRLKESAKTKEIPFIFLTASKQDGLRQQATSLGAAAFFEKPYDFEYLLAAIRAVVEHPHARLSL